MSDHIKDYWESQGKNHGASHWASWGDNWMIDLEIETIGAYLKEGDDVVDIGCANGFSAFRQYKGRKLKSITGIDFASNMIQAANETRQKEYSNENIDFRVGDVRSLDLESNRYDAAYTTRVLINLPTWEEQKKGIEECIRVVKPGGVVILSEGFWEPLCLLNSLRGMKGLPSLVEHDFNRYIKLPVIKQYFLDRGLQFEINDFSSIYYLGSRFLRELVTDPTAYEGFTNPINKFFYELEQQFSGGGFGIQQAIVIRK